MSTKRSLMPDTQLALLIDRLMRRIHAALQAKAHAFDTERLGPVNSMILLTLGDMGPSAIQDLTRRVGRDKSQMTRAVHLMEGKGLLERAPSPSDARVSVVSLTEKGEAMVEMLRGVLAETIDEVLDPISAGERATLTEVLSRVVR